MKTMREFVVFWWLAMRSSGRPFLHLEGIFGILILLAGLMPIILPSIKESLNDMQNILATSYSSWGAWLLAFLGAFLIFMWSPFKVWKQTNDELKKLQAEKDSKAPNVELRSFERELQYQVNRNMNGLIEIHLFAELINDSTDNPGRLRYFELDISTDKGIYKAVAERPTRNYLFESPSIYPATHFVFTGKVADEIATEILHIKSWEPYIRGAKGIINLAVIGQELQTYEVKIADEGKIWESKILA